MSKKLLNMPTYCIEHLIYLKEEGLFNMTFNNIFDDRHTYNNLKVCIFYYVTKGHSIQLLKVILCIE